MLTVERVDTTVRAQVRRFVHLPYRLYVRCPQWVPPLLGDAAFPLDRRRHPFYEHSDAAFFLAVRDGRDVGRIAALEHRPFNTYHSTRQARFFLFECEEDLEAAAALFEQVFAWARARGLRQVAGPMGFSAFDGYGLLVAGFEHRQTMTMASYNFPYYARLLEALGFEKAVDFDSWYLDGQTFRLPERAHAVAERVRRRGTLRVKQFSTVRELRAWAPRIGAAYNEAFRHNWEYYPLSQREIAFLVDTLARVADPRLITVILYGEEIAGFLLAFPDVSAALQRARGHLFPWGLIDLLLERRRTRRVALNGVGIIPRFQGAGGNVLLYTTLERMLRERGFLQAEVTQVAETALQVRRDIARFGAIPYKKHRVYMHVIG